MINRMSIEKYAISILKRAVAAEYIGSATQAKINEEYIHEDFKELAERLGYKVEKVK